MKIPFGAEKMKMTCAPIGVDEASTNSEFFVFYNDGQHSCCPYKPPVLHRRDAIFRVRITAQITLIGYPTIPADHRDTGAHNRRGKNRVIST